MYGEEETLVYDLLYNRIKDYRGEATQLAAMIRERRPKARMLLDVGCGTGNHLVHLAAEEFDVEGVESSAAMAAAARRKLPKASIHDGDMRTFALGRRYDAVVSLFSAIGYMLTVDDLTASIRAMADHLEPGGVMVIEPWFSRDRWDELEEGNVGINLVQPEDEVLVRMVRSSSQGRVSHMEMHYLYGTSTDIRHIVEHHDLGLFEADEYESAFESAGIAVDRREPGFSGRGLYVGVRRA
jgi:dTDP-3-amino-3,6-dideoxy-alpha-D-glucopyranose N,N-dimethyltransferase/dTDP-3-amino-3,4,6-trideoxy-alpha-D-glucopyranose N,N-dimethyltransferase/N-methyltransferase